MATGKFAVTALTRKDSASKIPEGCNQAHVDYSDESTLVDALRNQKICIITMSPLAPLDSHSKIVRAAAKAGVPYIMPNGYAGDLAQKQLGQDIILGPVYKANREEIESLGMQWITVCCGYWYDYSVAGGSNRFGFDFDERTVTMYGDGTVQNTMSTLAQVGRAVAKVLSLPELPADEDDSSLTMSQFLGKGIYIDSFTVSQKDVFESAKRVTGTSDSDWTVTYIDPKKRYEEGLAEFRAGNMIGLARLMYARSFFPEDPSRFPEKSQNKLLGLPDEDLDEATRAGIEMVPVLQARRERMAS